MLDPMFNIADLFMHVAAPKVTSFIRSVLLELEPPKSMSDRNLAQLKLARRVAEQFDLEVVSAVEAVAPLYAARFPRPLPRPKMLRRIGNASIAVTGNFPH